MLGQNEDHPAGAPHPVNGSVPGDCEQHPVAAVRRHPRGNRRFCGVPQGCLGLGQAELVNLRWQSVDLRNNTISVLRIKTDTPFDIPIYPQAKALIERRKKITGTGPEAPVS